MDGWFLANLLLGGLVAMVVDINTGEQGAVSLTSKGPNMRYQRFANCLCQTLLGILCGCSASRLPDYPIKPVTEYGLSKSEGGVTVAVHPMTDPKECENYFGMNLLKSDLLAVLVAVENKSADASYIIQKDSIRIVDAREALEGRSAVGNPDAANAVGGAVGVSILVSPLTALVLIPIAVNMTSNAAETRRNFAAKELHQETISPGVTKRGFAYFQLPKDRPDPMKTRLRLELLDPMASKTLTLDYDLEIGGK